MKVAKQFAAIAVVLLSVVVLTACGGATPGPKLYSLGGSVSGLTGTGLVLKNNTMAITISSNGAFRFNQALTSGTQYNVSIGNHPTNQSCSVSNGTGTVSSSDVTNIFVNCTNINTGPGNGTGSYTVGGIIKNVAAGETVSLKLNDGLAQSFTGMPTMTMDVNFTFTTTPLSNANAYNVTVFSPTVGARICSVSQNYNGTINNSNVTNVEVVCGTKQTLTINTSGMTGTGLQLRLNDGIAQSVTSPFDIAQNATYKLQVVSHPTNQICRFSNSQTSITGVANTSSTIQLNCVAGVGNYAIKGLIKGLLSNETVNLSLNGSSQSFSSTGVSSTGQSFTFNSQLASGISYDVRVVSLSPSSARTCSRSSNYMGTVGSSDVTTVEVVCGNTQNLGISISGLTGTGLQVSVNDEYGDRKIINSGSTSSVFQRAAGSNYKLTIVSQPTGQTCRFSNQASAISGVVSTTPVSMTCGTGSGNGNGTITGQVQPVFSSNGINWNSYVSIPDFATASRWQFVQATDIACNAAGTSQCLHAGEFRQFVLTGQTSCLNVTAQDSAQALKWVCDQTNGTPRMVSVGFNDGKGLNDLIDWTPATPVWKSMTLTVSRNFSTIATTTPSQWWNNMLMNAATAANSNLSMSGGVYYLDQDKEANFIISADKVALVVHSTSTLAHKIMGSSIASNENANAVVAITGDYVWLEGVIDVQQRQGHGVNLQGARFGTLRGVSVENALKAGVNLAFAHRMRLQTVNSSRNASGMKLASVTSSQFDNIVLNSNLTVSGGADPVNRHGLVVLGSNDNTFSRIRSFNNSGRGIWLVNGSKDNRFVDIIAANNETGLYVDAFSTANSYEFSKNNIFHNVTLANAGGVSNGLYIQGTDNRLERVAVINSATNGMSIQDDRNTLVNIASVHNGVAPIRISSNADTVSVEGHALFSGNCDIQSATGSSLSNVTCAAANNALTFVDTTVSLLGSFVGKYAQHDVSNPTLSQTTSQAGSGSYLLSNLNDWEWARFGNDYRGWAPDGNVVVDIAGDSRNNISPEFPSYLHRGPLAQSTGANYVLRIWDWSLKFSDSQLKARLLQPSSGANSNTAVDTHTWSNSSSVSYLASANELIGDGAGNDNGLCESNETCYFTPNIGAYQGHGDLQVSNANFSTSGGIPVQNVEYLTYTTNGY